MPLAAGGAGLYAASLTSLLAAGIWAADEAERAFGSPDDGRIVIDEVVGQLLALTPLLGDPASLHSPLLARDRIRRIPGVRCLEAGARALGGAALLGGRGVMLDDVVAGAFAALLLAARCASRCPR